MATPSDKAVEAQVQDPIRPEPLASAVEQFERDNPAVSKAMDLFGMSLAEYQGALNAMRAPHIYQSSSTVRRDARRCEAWIRFGKK